MATSITGTCGQSTWTFWERVSERLHCSIALGVLVAGPNSGGHLHPGFTISFALFKGFPWRKVPQYIIAQLLGSFIGGLVVYGSFKPQLVAMTQKLVASGKRSEIFSPAGPSGTFVVYEPPNSTMGVVFMNEIFGDIVLGIIVYSVLDPSNVFVIPTMVPVYIGLGFFAAIAAYAGNGIAYNTARDLGARFAAACFWGTGVFPSRITAEAVLTNIAGVIIGGAVQKFWLSDSIRPHTEHATQLAAAQEKEREAHLHRVLTARSSERGGMLTRVLSGRLSSNGDAAEKNPA